MAQPAYKSAGTQVLVSTAGGSASVLWPAGTKAGDVGILVAVVPNTTHPDGPSGWNTCGQLVELVKVSSSNPASSSASAINVFPWWHTADVDDPPAVSVTAPIAGTYFVIYTFTGVGELNSANASGVGLYGYSYPNNVNTTISGSGTQWPALTIPATHPDSGWLNIVAARFSTTLTLSGGLTTLPKLGGTSTAPQAFPVFSPIAVSGYQCNKTGSSQPCVVLMIELPPSIDTTPISGDMSLGLGMSGTLSASAALTGDTSMTLGMTGALTGTAIPEGILRGNMSLGLDMVGDPSADAPLTGDMSLGLGMAGTLIGSDVRALSGAMSLGLGMSATLTASAIGVLRGNTAMQLGMSAKLTLHQPSKFYALFADVYLKRQALLNAILTAARILATAPQDVPAEVQAQIDAAEAAANAANAELATIASDGILSPVEKPTVIRDNNVIIIERAGIDLQAAAFGVVSEKATYDNAVTALSSYLATLTDPTMWSDLTGDTTIVGATFRQKFADVYTSRQACLNAIYASAKVRADAAQATADTATALASAVNVMNPGFDSGEIGWDMEPGWTIRTDNQSPGIGPGYAQHAGSSSSSQTAAIRNRAWCLVVQGQSYKVQALIQGIGATGLCGARISWRDLNGIEVAVTRGNDIIGNATGGSTAVGKPPANAVFARAEAAVYNHTSGTYKIDNITSTLQPSTADEIAESAGKKWAAESGATIGANWAVNLAGGPQSVGSNLVFHGDFNGAGAVEAWSGDGSVVANFPGLAFGKGLRTTGRDTYETDNTFPCNPGDVFYVAGRLAAGNTALRFGIRFRDINGTSTWVYGISQTAGVSWTYLQGAVVAPAGAISGQPWLSQNIAAGSGSSAGFAAQLDIQKTALAKPGSGQRLGDARNQAMVTVGNFGSAWSGISVTYSATSTSATISATSALLQMGSVAVAYNAASVSVSGSPGTSRTFYLYYDDPDYTGGSKSLVAATTYINSINDDGRVYLGPVTVAFPSSGTGGGTGGGGNDCPVREAWVIKRGADGDREFVRAGSVVIGDYLALVNGEWGQVSYSMPALVPCARIAVGGPGSPYTLSCSTTAPIGLTDGGQVLAPDALGADARVLQSYPRVDTHVTSVRDIGSRWVQHITCQDTFFWVGDSANCLFSHHNLKMVPR